MLEQVAFIVDILIGGALILAFAGLGYEMARDYLGKGRG